MKIDFTYDTIKGEPGPNLYLMGSKEDFNMLSVDMTSLINLDDKEIVLNELPYVEVMQKQYTIKFRSVKDGNIISKIDGNLLSIELDTWLWEKFFIRSIVLSRSAGHFYMEFDNYTPVERLGLSFREDFNMIWSSEW